MGTVNFWVKGGGRHEFSCKRLERMLRGACCSSNLGLKPEDIKVEPDGPVSMNGASGPLQLAIELSSDLLDQLAPPLDPKAKDTSDRSDSSLRRFVQKMGETARDLGPENGWPQRQVQVRTTLTDVSWSG
ncbi:hypothetical protein HZB93_01135 [Candidatus Falkowbacteria bacterium]|nr:hypothetical protein [Candidatus Falkowbacteria bacterium]